MKNANATEQQTSAYINDLNKEFREFEMWMKYMNYKLFLEHAHSNEYYKRKQLLLLSNRRKSIYEKTL